MLKILFLEFAELAQGDGKGPKYFPGKAYWLTPDQAIRWKAEGVAEDAPADMPAENEEARGPAPLRPDSVRIVRTKGSRYNVVGPDDYKFNDEPISAADAERLRKDVLDGKVTMSVAEPVQEPAPLPPTPPQIDLNLDADEPQAIVTGDVVPTSSDQQPIE